MLFHVVRKGKISLMVYSLVKGINSTMQPTLYDIDQQLNYIN